MSDSLKDVLFSPLFVVLTKDIKMQLVGEVSPVRCLVETFLVFAARKREPKINK